MRVRLPLTLAAAIALSTPATASAAFVHTVMPGESLASIAAADGVSVDQLAAANGLSPTAQLVAGSTVSIPPQGAAAPGTTSTPAAASTNFAHTVLPGESLTSIAAADGLSVDQLAAANGLSPTAQLITGSSILIPSGAAAASAAPTTPAAAPNQSGDGDADTDDPGSAATAAPGTPTATSATSATAGSIVVQPGDTLSAIAARGGTSVAALAAANGLDPNGVLPAGTALTLPGPGTGAPPPAQAPAVGTTVVGRMTWFGGPNDPSAQGAPASGLGFRTDGMSYYNEGSLGNRWLIKFPWGQSLPMTQIDVGPAPWTGNPFDIAYSALPSTPYNESTWPNPVVTGTYEGP